MSEAGPTPAHKRRFRWSLRSFFVAVTIVCCWLGYEVSWIRQRERFTQEQSSRIELRDKGWVAVRYSEKIPKMPGLLGFFGKSGQRSLEVLVDGKRPHKLTAGDRATLSEAKRLFPEASIHAVHIEQAETWSVPARPEWIDGPDDPFNRP